MTVGRPDDARNSRSTVSPAACVHDRASFIKINLQLWIDGGVGLPGALLGALEAFLRVAFVHCGTRWGGRRTYVGDNQRDAVGFGVGCEANLFVPR